jgi:hypothetical protein
MKFSASKMKYGVIGEPCIDFIYRGGKEMKSFGGVLYSVVSLAVMAGSDEVYPIMNLGADEFDNITLFLGKFKNIKQDFINKVEHKTRVVKLYYKGLEAEFEDSETGKPKTYDREESSTEPTLPVDYKHIEPALGMLDGLLINMVSGVDVTLETLKKIRKNFGGYIHADLHNVVMKTDKKGNRTRSGIPNWEEWCAGSDTLQMNEAEMYAMPGKKLSEYEFAEQVLSTGEVNHGKALVVTRGKSGVSLFRKIDKKVMGEVYSEIDKVDLPSVESYSFKDSTGCGDVFAAAFFLKCIQNSGKDCTPALKFANRMAALNTALRGVEELDKLV